MRKSVKKIVGVILSAAMVLSVSTASVSEAAANYSVAVPVSYNNATWNTKDLAGKSSSTVAFGSGVVSEADIELNVSFQVSVPKMLFTGSTTKKDQALVINTGVGISTKEDEDTDAYKYVGTLDTQYPIECRKVGGKYKFSYWDEDEEAAISLDNSVKAVEKGDFVQIKASNIMLKDSVSEEDAEEDFSPYYEYMYSFYMAFTGVYMKGKTSILVDSYSFNNADGNAMCSYGFKSQKNTYINVSANGSKAKEVKPFVRTDYLLKVAKTNLTVKKGKSVAVKATASPKATVKYTSSNKKVATVTAKGVVKGVKPGKAVITVTANGVSKKVNVTVKK